MVIANRVNLKGLSGRVSRVSPGESRVYPGDDQIWCHCGGQSGGGLLMAWQYNIIKSIIIMPYLCLSWQDSGVPSMYQ